MEPNKEYLPLSFVLFLHQKKVLLNHTELFVRNYNENVDVNFFWIVIKSKAK